MYRTTPPSTSSQQAAPHAPNAPVTTDTIVVKNGRPASKLTSGRSDLGTSNPTEDDWESMIDRATD
jgi:hypothetical protein